MLVEAHPKGVAPLYQRSIDYLYNMSALTSKEARRQWRQSIKAAWNNHCAYCDQPPIDDSSLTIDHVKPRSKGGKDCTSNVIPACLECNHSKGSENWQDWFRRQEFYAINREIEIKKWLSECQPMPDDPMNNDWCEIVAS